jgi:hypothetical protein
MIVLSLLLMGLYSPVRVLRDGDGGLGVKGKTDGKENGDLDFGLVRWMVIEVDTNVEE